MSTETVIEVERLSKHFPIRNVIGTVTGLVKAVDGIDLRIEAGKTWESWGRVDAAKPRS